MRGLRPGLACVLIACGSSSPRDPTSRPAVAAPAVTPADAAAPPDALALPDAAQRVVGHLKPPPAKVQVWPTRVCVDGSGLVFENDCGCNDALLCHVDRADPATVAITLGKDPARRPMCDDCYPMVPARCELPPGGPARTIEINGAAAFTLPAGAADGSCWTARP